MMSIKNDILNILKQIKGAGKFVSVHTENFVFPGLEVNGIGEISYPVNAIQAKALIEVAQKAPFGKGNETILDDAVRSAWEIDAVHVHFKGEQWNNLLNKAIFKIKENLGLKDYSVSAGLYKMLVYEKGDFFLAHKDSEKEKGMFGTMLLVLPSHYIGGELVVQFDGLEEVADFATTSAEYKIGIAAFYADCDHEIKPLTSGYRICLVYNLIQDKPGKNIQHVSLGAYVNQLSALFKKTQEAANMQPYIVLLGHQYTPENFSYDALKLNDRPKAEALLQAAKKANYYAKMCLVTSFKSGAPEFDGYDDDVDDYTEIGEVFDEWQAVVHWLSDDIPNLSDLHFQEEDLLASFALDAGEPIIKESTGYMGNYGPDINHWYHYGAVLIWSKEVNAELLLSQNTVTQLQWLRYFCENPAKISASESHAVNVVLSSGLKNVAADVYADYNAIADWVILQKDPCFFKKIDVHILRLYFTEIETTSWIRLFAFLSAENAHEIINRVMENALPKTFEQLLSLLCSFMRDVAYTQLAAEYIEKLPFYFEAMFKRRNSNNPSINNKALEQLFWLSEQSPQSDNWINGIIGVLTRNRDHNYLNLVLAPTLLGLQQQNRLTQQLLIALRKYFQQIERNMPQPPSDWRRLLPDIISHKKQWEILKPFLESPVQTVFEYRKNQNERADLERAIKNVSIDLETETIKKGSPHTLKITKTQAAYRKNLKVWKEDMALMRQIEERM